MRFKQSTQSRLPAMAGCIFLAFALMIPPAGAQDAVEIELPELVRETQQFSDAADRLTLIWWLPPEFWRVSFEATGDLTESAIEEMMEVVEPYVTVAVVQGSVGPFGAAEFQDEERVRKSLRLVDEDGEEYLPLAGEEISPDLRNFFQGMRPIMAGMMGPMGESFHFFVFPARSSDGEPIANATGQGSFTVKVSDEAFTWRLPLGSLLAPKRCPVDGERMSGAW